MCGISGIYNCSDKDIGPKKIIENIIKLQDRRGPDDRGIWQSTCKKTTFGHNRLSIIDLTDKAKQPLISKDNNLIITYNGEIYNYKEIRNELSKNKVTFKSSSDTEVILESYKYWGIEFVKKLRGMFAFAIWDNIKKEGFNDTFRRMWRYYLGYCEGGFKSGNINVGQFLIKKN